MNAPLFTTEEREKLGRYHTGLHEACVTCRLVMHVDAQTVRIAVLQEVATRVRNFTRNLVELGGLEYQGDRAVAEGLLTEMNAALKGEPDAV